MVHGRDVLNFYSLLASDDHGGELRWVDNLGAVPVR